MTGLSARQAQKLNSGNRVFAFKTRAEITTFGGRVCQVKEKKNIIAGHHRERETPCVVGDIGLKHP